jgi:hypothetical protein
MVSWNASWRLHLTVVLAVMVGCGGDSSGESRGGTDSASTTITTTVGSVTLTTSSASSNPDPDTGTTDGDGSTSGPDSTTGTATCPTTHACVAVPEGWMGPVVLRTSTATQECPDGYPDLESIGGTDLLAPAAQCDCSCGAAAGTTCALATTLHYWGTDPTCSNGTPVGSYNLFTTVCNDLNAVLPANTYFQVEPVLVDGGSCTAEQTMSLDPPVFVKTSSTCGGAELLEGCEGGEVCAPRANGDAMCVWQDGDADCPEGFEGQRSLTHRSIDDTRSCDDCTCGDPLGLCDGASITMFANVCNPPISALLDVTGECDLGSAASATRSAIFAVGEPNAFCVASDAVATGVATPTDPVTVCCAA